MSTTTSKTCMLLSAIGWWIAFIQVATASLSFSFNGVNHNYATYDPLLVNVPYYKHTGPIHRIRFDHEDSYGCKVSLPDTDTNAAIATNNTNVIAVIEETTAMYYGCQTIAQISAAVAEHSRTRQSAGHPPISALLVLLDQDNCATSGGPQDPLTVSHKVRIPDGKLEMPTALLPIEHIDEFSTIMTETTESLMLTLEQEQGPWNSVLFSQNYSATRWILVALCVCSVLYSLFKVALLIRSKTFRFEKSFIVLSLAMLASIFIVVFISLNEYTLAATILFRLGSIILWFAFCFALYLWTSTIDEIRNKKDKSFRVVLLILMAIVFASYLANLILAFTTASTSGKVVAHVFTYLQTAIYVILVAIISHYDISFRLENHQEMCRPSRQRVFKTLRVSIGISAITLFVESVTNTATITGLFHGEIPATVACWLIDDTCFVIRCVALLSLYSVRKMRTIGNGPDDYYSIYSSKWTQCTSAQPSPALPKSKPELRVDTSHVTTSTPRHEHLTIQIPTLSIRNGIDRALSPILYDNPLFTQNITPTPMFP
ncbi:hypothetical protein BDF22DRAFT_772817 [Syncephalis plumigaleata]|nr:hypothetical protein BDF22DRAFT_772817 [Syncephalis plumigaleata]